ncbi:MAG: methyltransferase domain-containing protein [Bacteroidota bacterium]
MNRCFLCNNELAATPFYYNYKEQQIRVVRCVSCGLGTLHPMLASEEVLALYNVGYFERDYRCGTTDRSYAEEVEKLKHEARQFLPIIEKHAGGKRYLEVGCAGGAMLAEAQHRGFTAIGVEVSREMADWGRKNLHVDIREGTVEDQKFTNEAFDVVFLGDVIEHLAHPQETMLEISRILSGKGIIALAFPMELNGIIPRMRVVLNFQRESPDKPYHLFYYDLGTMRTLLEQSGFTVVYSRQEKLVRMQSLRTVLTDLINKSISALTGRFGDRGFIVARKEATAKR